MWDVSEADLYGLGNFFLKRLTSFRLGYSARTRSHFFRFLGPGIGVSLGVQGFGLRIWGFSRGLGFRAEDLGLLWEFRVSGVGFGVSIGVLGFGLRELAVQAFCMDFGLLIGFGMCYGFACRGMRGFGCLEFPP